LSEFAPSAQAAFQVLYEATLKRIVAGHDPDEALADFEAEWLILQKRSAR